MSNYEQLLLMFLTQLRIISPLLFTLSGLTPLDLQSQEIPIPNRDFINIDENFPKRGITSIIHDHKGFIWIATYGAGLYKYDGASHVGFNFNPDDSCSLSSNMVNDVYEDRASRLWIATDDGVNLYDENLGNFRRIYAQFDAEKLDISVLSLLETSEGDMLLGTANQGLFHLRIDGDRFELRHVDHTHFGVDDLDIYGMAISSYGEIYLASSIGLLRIAQESLELEIASIYAEKESISLRIPIVSLCVDHLNNLWIGTSDEGLYKSSCINSSSPSLKFLEHLPLTNRRVLAIDQDDAGYLYFGTENDGLIVMNPIDHSYEILQRGHGAMHGIKSNSVWHVYCDHDSRLWLGYYDKGVDVHDPQVRKFGNTWDLVEEPEELQKSSLTGIAKDGQGNLWFSTDGNGLHFLDRENQVLTSSSGTSGSNSGRSMQTVFIDSKENVWAGSWDEGLFYKRSGQKQFSQFTSQSRPGDIVSDRVISFDEDEEGIIWFGTWGAGIHSFDPDDEEFRHHVEPVVVAEDLQVKDVSKILCRPGRIIWVAATTGLFQLRYNQDQDIISVKSMLPEWLGVLSKHTSVRNVISMYFDSQERLWFGTDGSGLYCYDFESDSVRHFGKKDGFLQESVSSINEVDQRYIWTSGRSGLSMIDLRQNEILNYTRSDGLISNDFNANASLLDNQGYLFFGNVLGGVNYFKPESIAKIESGVLVYLTDLKIFNKSVFPGEEDSPLMTRIENTEKVRLSYKQSVFTIDYTGLNFTRPDKIQFAYYLDGLEDDWNYVGNQRSATYTSLKSGKYQFRVKAANSDGVWNDDYVTLDVEVLPAWYRSNSAITIYVLLFLMVLYALYRLMRTRVLAKREADAERLQREQAQELNRKKIQFFTNISHEFRTPLTLIVNPLEDIIDQKDHVLPADIKSKHHIIHKNAKRLQRLINELMDFRKLSFNKYKLKLQNTEMVSFTNGVAEYFEAEAVSNNIEFTKVCNVSQLSAWIDPSLIEKVIFNLLSNAFKVTHTGGSIEVLVESCVVAFDGESEKEAVKIEVRDTGPGLSPEHLRHIFDRFYQVENLDKSYYGGTGIGLEVVKDFIKLHDGKIDVESTLGVGTQFKVFLPLESDQIMVRGAVKASSVDFDVIRDSDVESTDQKISEKSRSTLMIIEDNAELKNYLSSELSKTYQVMTASDGAEGLQMTLEHLPDIVITDVMMPVLDGFELCKTLKADVRTSHIPIVMLTAKSSSDDQISGVDSGADAYVTKPFSMTLLKSRLIQLLQSRKVIFNHYFSELGDSELSENLSRIDQDFLQQLVGFINTQISDASLNVESLSEKMFLSRSQLYRKTKALTGISVNALIRKIRLRKAKTLLQKGNLTVSEVCFAVGFSSPSYFSKSFKKEFGELPKSIVKGTGE